MYVCMKYVNLFEQLTKCKQNSHSPFHAVALPRLLLVFLKKSCLEITGGRKHLLAEKFGIISLNL